MILKDNKGIAIRISDVRNMRKIVYRLNDSTNPRYCIELRYKHSNGNNEYSYGNDKDERDADFERVNRVMDSLDGIQQ